MVMTAPKRAPLVPRNATASRGTLPIPPPHRGVGERRARRSGEAAIFVASMAIRLPVGRRSASAMADVAITTHAPCSSTGKGSRRDALYGRGLSFCLRQRRGESRVTAAFIEGVSCGGSHPLPSSGNVKRLNKRSSSPFFLFPQKWLWAFIKNQVLFRMTSIGLDAQAWICGGLEKNCFKIPSNNFCVPPYVPFFASRCRRKRVSLEKRPRR